MILNSLRGVKYYDKIFYKVTRSDKMSQKRNLNKKKIIEATFLVADEVGIDNITFPKIAERLGIKYPSLYNHFDNIKRK